MAGSPLRTALSADRGDIVTGWLGKMVAGLAVVAIIAIDGVTVGMAHVGVVDDANTAADAARDSYSATHDIEAAYAAAKASATSSNAADQISAKQFRVDRDGTVTLTVTRPIHTLVAHYLPMDGVRGAQGVGTASPVTS